MSCNPTCNIVCCNETQQSIEININDNFKMNGYITLWKNIYSSIAMRDIDLTLEYIFKSNESRFMLLPKYVLPDPPNNTEKFLYMNSGVYSYLMISILSSCSIIIGYIFFSISSPFLYIYFSYIAALCLYYLINHYIIIIGSDMNYPEHIEICNNTNISNISVDIFLPVCGEEIEVISNTWKYIHEIDFPNYNIYVLDDGNSKEVESLSILYNFNYIVRDNIPELKKSGNMRNAFKITSGDYILVLDADFVPRKDILTETIPLMEYDKNIGILQTPQYFRNSHEQSWLEKGAAGLQEVFYRIVQISRNHFNASLCVGTSAIYRRSALAQFGGSAPVEHSEDVITGLYVMNIGFKIKYLPLVLSIGVCPGEIYPFFTQQYRWCVGSFLLMFHKRDLWLGKNISFMQRACFVNGFSYYIFHTMSPFFSPICIICIIYFFPEQMTWVNIMFVIPSLLNDVVFHKLWTTQNIKTKIISFDKASKIQSIAFFYSFRDAVFNNSTEWVPTGTKITKYNISKIRLKLGLKCMFLLDSAVMTVVIVGSVLRITDGFPYYVFLYVILQSVYQFLLSFHIILYFLHI